MKSKQGFASLTPERLREICSQGGKSVPAAKRSFSRNKVLASIAGSKGGSNGDPNKRAFKKDPELAKRATAIARANRAARQRTTVSVDIT